MRYILAVVSDRCETGENVYAKHTKSRKLGAEIWLYICSKIREFERSARDVKNRIMLRDTLAVKAWNDFYLSAETSRNDIKSVTNKSVFNSLTKIWNSIVPGSYFTKLPFDTFVQNVFVRILYARTIRIISISKQTRKLSFDFIRDIKLICRTLETTSFSIMKALFGYI